MVVIVPVALLKLCGVVCASFIRRAHPDWSIVSLCAPIHSCLYLLSMILSSVWSSVCVQVNPCFKSNKAYYINFFREFDNDIARTKVELMPGCPLKWLWTSKSCERLPGKVLAAVLLPFVKNWCWLSSANGTDLAQYQLLTWLWYCIYFPVLCLMLNIPNHIRPHPD